MLGLNYLKLKTGINRTINWFNASMLLKLRLINAEKRVLPSFIIIWAQKSGTSSLYYYLKQHPQLIPSFLKEIQFFDGGHNPEIDNYCKGPLWYRAFFPKQSNVQDGRIAFKASPMYIFHLLTPGKIAKLLPDIKIIALLRNPASRAISHYCHE